MSSARITQVFEAEQFVPRGRPEVFAFFSTPTNLEAITPPWLRFRIVGQSTAAVGEGTRLTYKLRLRGLPLKWVSRIEEWKEGERFVDVQLHGPYAFWHHTHTFEDVPGGTMIRDRVRYRLRFGALANLLIGGFVRRDVRKIFDYRKKRIAELLP